MFFEGKNVYRSAGRNAPFEGKVNFLRNDSFWRCRSLLDVQARRIFGFDSDQDCHQSGGLADFRSEEYSLAGNEIQNSSPRRQQIGGKLEMKKEQYHRVAPGVAVQYEAELPTASQEALQGYGQHAIFLLNHHYGKNGDLDVIVNGWLLQSDCQTRARCSYGGQQSMALSYHLQKDTRLYIEAFGQNTSQSNTPPGTYVFGGFYHQFSDAFGLDGGMRFGVSDHSASIGTTIGVVFGKRL